MENNNNGANISDGIYRIIRSFKSFSHFFIRMSLILLSFFRIVITTFRNSK